MIYIQSHISYQYASAILPKVQLPLRVIFISAAVCAGMGTGDNLDTQTDNLEHQTAHRDGAQSSVQRRCTADAQTSTAGNEWASHGTFYLTRALAIGMKIKKRKKKLFMTAYGPLGISGDVLRGYSPLLYALCSSTMPGCIAKSVNRIGKQMSISKVWGYSQFKRE